MNWFRKGTDGKFLWPGYGDNVRVLKWMLDRIEGRAEATETPIGYVPTPKSLTLDGLSISRDALDELLRVDPAELGRGTSGHGKILRKVRQPAAGRNSQGTRGACRPLAALHRGFQVSKALALQACSPVCACAV